MLTALIRPAETRTLNLTGASGAEIRDAVAAKLPAGWELAGMPLKLDRETSGFASKVTISRRDGVQTIEAADMDALHALVPDGWQMLSVVVT